MNLYLKHNNYTTNLTLVYKLKSLYINLIFTLTNNNIIPEDEQLVHSAGYCVCGNRLNCIRGFQIKFIKGII